MNIHELILAQMKNVANLAENAGVALALGKIAQYEFLLTQAVKISLPLHAYLLSNDPQSMERHKLARNLCWYLNRLKRDSEAHGIAQLAIEDAPSGDYYQVYKATIDGLPMDLSIYSDVTVINESWNSS